MTRGHNPDRTCERCGKDTGKVTSMFCKSCRDWKRRNQNRASGVPQDIRRRIRVANQVKARLAREGRIGGAENIGAWGREFESAVGDG